MKIKCNNCQQEFDEKDMKPLNIGKATQYMCPSCYKRGNSDATFRARRFWRGVKK